MPRKSFSPPCAGIPVKRPLLFAISILLASPVGAVEFCKPMGALTTQARSNFTDLVDPAALKPLPEVHKCNLSKSLSGANAYHCAWKFPYRDVAANEAFDAFNQMMRDCFADHSEVIKDAGVNHPDTYVQRQHLVDDVVVSVSLKDKGALQETYVFVGIQSAKFD